MEAREKWQRKIKMKRGVRIDEFNGRGSRRYCRRREVMTPHQEKSEKCLLVLNMKYLIYYVHQSIKSSQKLQDSSPRDTESRAQIISESAVLLKPLLPNTKAEIRAKEMSNKRIHSPPSLEGVCVFVGGVCGPNVEKGEGEDGDIEWACGVGGICAWVECCQSVMMERSLKLCVGTCKEEMKCGLSALEEKIKSKT